MCQPEESREDGGSIRVRDREPVLRIVRATAVMGEIPYVFGIAVNDPELAGVAATKAAILANTGVVVTDADPAWRTRLGLEYSAELPAAEQFASEVGLAAQEG